MQRIMVFNKVCANCEFCDTYGRNGHYICRKDGKIYRGLEPAWTTCDEWEPI